ncbi:MAG: DDE-type integrase/transposase/recombinase, partial [Candidatus Omnitrophota bacterium]
MITKEAQHRAKVLTFWKTYGLDATKEAFKVGRSTLFDWQRRLDEGKGKLEALNPRKRTPRVKRKRIWKPEIIIELEQLRKDHPNLGKDKIFDELAPWCKERGWKCPSESTIGRLIKDKGGLRIYPQKVSHFGKIKKLKRVKKIRKPKDFVAQYPGHLVSLDTIVKVVFGRRIYIITFVDVYSRIGFAWATTSHASLASSQFFLLIKKAFPYKIKYLLTDNGSEF